MSYNGWMISDSDRAKLLALFPPVFPNVKMSHVTLEHGCDPYEIPVNADLCVVGYVTDNVAQVLVVEVNGTSERPDKGTFHITVSFANGASAKESLVTLEKAEPVAVNRTPLTGHGFYCEGKGKPYITTPLTSL